MYVYLFRNGQIGLVSINADAIVRYVTTVVSAATLAVYVRAEDRACRLGVIAYYLRQSQIQMRPDEINETSIEPVRACGAP